MASEIVVPLVVTNPDRPAGRGMAKTPPPIKRKALDHGLEVLQPTRASDPALAERLRDADVEVAVVVAYGKILPGDLLTIPNHGFVNVHFSLLPAYRGAAPVQRALMDGCDTTGISLIRLTEGMDEGPIIATESVDIESEDTAASLGSRMATIGADLLARILPMYVSGAVDLEEQDHERATYAPKITSDDARIDWSEPSEEVRNFVRGLNPEPGAWTTNRGARWRILKVEAVEHPGLGPGELQVTKDALIVGTGDGAVAIAEVQPAGKKPMAGPDLGRGLRVQEGEKLQ